ncbi:MAG: GNAT family N-acetyltransferase [Firmicutes bacterium]|nr:GNAT family N-acetyltransferase [Bacillota bacterium]
MNFTLKKLTIKDFELIKETIRDIFSNPPWNDDWQDENQFNAYIIGMIGNNNSLVLGLFDENGISGITIGSIKYWYTGNIYCIDDLGIKTNRQGKGYGTMLIKLVENYIKENNINEIELRTNRTFPAYNFYLENGFTESENAVYFSKKI